MITKNQFKIIGFYAVLMAVFIILIQYIKAQSTLGSSYPIENVILVVGSLFFVTGLLIAWRNHTSDSEKKIQVLQQLDELSKRENEILALLIDEKSNKEMADLLFISLPTVKTHISNIYKKLEVNSRPTAILKVLEINKIHTKV